MSSTPDVMVLLVVSGAMVLAVAAVLLLALRRGSLTDALHMPLPLLGSPVTTRPCPRCGKDTLQGRHGYSAEGKLWKGHVCTCHGWHCFSCDQVFEKRPEGCCR